VAQVPQTTSMTRNEYKEDYRCTRCGHEWSVVRTKIT
jgi:ribosomal protein S14